MCEQLVHSHYMQCQESNEVPVSHALVQCFDSNVGWASGITSTLSKMILKILIR